MQKYHLTHFFLVLANVSCEKTHFLLNLSLVNLLKKIYYFLFQFINSNLESRELLNFQKYP